VTILNCIGFVFVFVSLAVAIKGEPLAQDNDPRNSPRAYKYETPDVWRESPIDLPVLSPRSSFSQYQTRSQTGFTFYIDISSIEFGGDGVVRMSLLAISPKGSENITYEGFRCETRENKLYASSWAFDAKWMPAKRAKWRSVSPKTPNSYRSDLLEYYICDGTLSILDERRLRALFKKGKMNKPQGIKGKGF